MSTISEVINQNQIERIQTRLAPYQIPSNNPYVQFAAKYANVTISIYTSKKIVLQGVKADEVAQELGIIATTPLKLSSTIPQEGLIGTDEVGNGSYFGGIAVVASYVSKEAIPYLKELGVGDSKTLTDEKILKIAPKLKKLLPHRALLLNPHKYNELVGDNKPYNAVSVKVALHNQAIYLLLNDGIKPDNIVIDAFTSSKNYNNYLQYEKNHFEEPVELIEKAEGQFLAVAASSIIARALFLESLDTLGETVQETLPSGAGTKSDQVAARILKTKGEGALKEVAKWHFKNTEKAKKLASRS